MSRQYYRSYSRGRYGSRRSAGHERALQHIEEARQLSVELGGTDQDVKEYFFSLPKSELDAVLDEYGRIYGRQKQQYAIETLDDWSSGRRKMSGLVASRLFNLLPPRMPLGKKYELVESLWRYLSPKSKKVYTVGYDTPPSDIIDTASRHLIRNVDDFMIPKGLERRFEWLSAGDVNVRQQLLNHFQKVERESILQGARRQVPALVEHLNSVEGAHTNFAAQEISLGNHTVRLEFRKGHKGITEGALSPPVSSKSSNLSGEIPGWVYIIAILIVIFLLIR